ncbi:TolC family outer membrane protein [Halopseudomonas oceani]|uniref:TolC family outer membrane protein n=1 Tax=Halopseudomonas oceani TaxID=1708783 RepID=UPI002AA8FFDE|nr:TolC family outer membrane protein [Halopseudomonas oceani]
MRTHRSTLMKQSSLARGRRSLALAIGLAICSMSAQAETDSLRAVVAETLDSNPEISSSLQAYYASQHDARVAAGGYLPSIDVDASLGQGNRQFDNRSDYSRNYAEISLTQMLFDGFRVRNNLAHAEYSSRALYYEALSEAEAKALEAAEAYLDVLRYRDLVGLAQENLSHHLRVQQHVEERAESGVGNHADLKQIEGRVSLARSNLMTEVANLQSVTARFQRLVGRAPSDDMDPVSIPQGRVPDSLEQVLNTSFANNPALYAAFENIRSAEADLGAAKANRYPTLELGLRQGIYKNNNSFDNRTDPDSYGSENIVELRMRYNLFNGGSDRAAERAAHSRINQAQSLRDKACVDLRQTATIAYTDILNIEVRKQSLAAHRDASGSVIEAYRQQFDIGRRTLLDVLDSENEAYQAERAYVAGKYDQQLAELRTLQSMGTLLSTLSVTGEQVPTLEDALSGEAAPAESRYCSAYSDAQLNISQYDRAMPLAETVGLSGDALFDSGSAELKASALTRIKDIVEQAALGGGRVKSVRVVGHTDSTGSDALNRSLSQARAVAVRDFLISAGVQASVITATGVAADQPVASNATAEGRAQNRRVELLIERTQ